LLLWLSLALAPATGTASELAALDSAPSQQAFNEELARLVTEQVRETYDFFGLANYLKKVDYLVISPEEIRHLTPGDSVALQENEWFAARGRFTMLAMRSQGLVIEADEAGVKLQNTELLRSSTARLELGGIRELMAASPELGELRYLHLWRPLQLLSILVEWSLDSLHRLGVPGWGLVVFVFAVLLKLLLVPVGIMTTNFQRFVSRTQTQLAPQLVEIKANFDGEEAHNRIMQAHKDLGVSPFYSLRPMTGLFIQVPVAIAVFNALAEMPQFTGQAWFWIENLAYPDSIAELPFAVPLLGQQLSLLPLIMTLFTVLAALLFKNPHLGAAAVSRQKRNLHLMATAFLVLFYPFPAVMVLYWALANVLQLIQQSLLKL